MQKQLIGKFVFFRVLVTIEPNCSLFIVCSHERFGKLGSDSGKNFTGVEKACNIVTALLKVFFVCTIENRKRGSKTTFITRSCLLVLQVSY